MTTQIHDSTTCTAGVNGGKCEMCQFASKSPSESFQGYPKPSEEVKTAPIPSQAPGMTTCRDCQGSGQGAGLGGICPYCHGTREVETYEARQRRLAQSVTTTIDFEHEWSTAPETHRRYTERAEAQWWLMRGLWLGIQYERERGLVAMNGDLREMQRIARERMG